MAPALEVMTMATTMGMISDVGVMKKALTTSAPAPLTR